jgi:flagella basal body P-ring formation protein FlgA
MREGAVALILGLLLAAPLSAEDAGGAPSDSLLRLEQLAGLSPSAQAPATRTAGADASATRSPESELTSLAEKQAAPTPDAEPVSGTALSGLVQMQKKAVVPAEAEPVSGTVSLKVSPTAHGPNIYLGDLIEGKLPLVVASEAVKPSGGPGTTATVDPQLVALKLKKASGGAFSLAGDGRLIKVAVPAQRVAGADVERFAESYLETRLSGVAGVRIERQGKVLEQRFYDAPLRLRIHPPDDHPLRGYVELRVEILQSQGDGEEQLVSTVPVSFLVHKQETRLFTTRAVNRGETLGPQDLTARDVDATFFKDGFGDMADVQGKVARTYIPPATLLSMDLVDLPLAIHNGDVVKLVVRSGAIEIVTSAKALRDARVGDGVPLQVQDSGRQVQGKCVDMDMAVENAW